MSLERKARQRLSDELANAGYLDPERRIIDTVWRVLGIRELVHERMFTPPYYEATEARSADTYNAFIWEEKRRMAQEIARVAVDRSTAEFSTEPVVSEHPDAQHVVARMLVITRLA